MFIPKAQEIYRHFKGNLYQIMAVAEHSETGEQLVIYQALYGTYKVYARPLEMFIEKVDSDKYPDVTQVYRFELQNGEDPRLAGLEDKVTDEKGMREPILEQGTGEQEELNIDPMVLEFLDADSYEQRLNILAGLQHRITDEMITTMAIACDIEMPEGSVEERYDSLRSCLLTLEKYECNRLR